LVVVERMARRTRPRPPIARRRSPRTLVVRVEEPVDGRVESLGISAGRITASPVVVGADVVEGGVVVTSAG